MEQRLLLCLENMEGAPALRKREGAIEELKNCLQEQRILAILDQNSKAGKNPKFPSWQDVFRNCHSLILFTDTEAEEEEKKNVPASVAKRKCRETVLNALGLVASKANRGSEYPHLQLGSTINICINALQQERWYKHHKQYGAMYLNILAKNIIPFKTYWHEMTPEQWKSLADFCIDVYGKVSDSEKDKVIKILETVIKRGSSQSPVAIHLKSKLEFFETVFKVDELDKKINLQESLLKLCYTIIKTLALESRLAMCKLGEKVLHPIMKLRSKIKTEGNSKLLTLLYDLLLMVVCLHHPGGIPKGESGAMAYDWVFWKRLLIELRSFVDTDVRSAGDAKWSRKTLRGENNLHPSLLKLAVEVYKQDAEAEEIGTDVSFAEASTSTYPIDSYVSKRRKLQGSLSSLIDQLKSAKTPEDTMHRLSIAAALLKKYPEIITTADYLELLQTLSNILTSCKNTSVMLQLCKCCKSLLGSESFIKFAKIESSAVDELWGKIWDMTLRAAGLNQCEDGCHSLLQALLLSSRGGVMLHIPLLRMLSSGVAVVSRGSIMTLAVLTQTRHLPSEQEKLQNMISSAVSYGHMSQTSQEAVPTLFEMLLKWLLPSFEACEDVKKLLVVSEYIYILAETLVRLIVTSGAPPVPSIIAQDVDENDMVYKIEQVYHQRGLQIISNSRRNEDEVKNKASAQFSTNFFKTLKKYLKKDFEFIIDKLTNFKAITKLSERFSVIRLSIQLVNLYANLLSVLLMWNLIKEDDMDNCPLTKDIKELLNKLPDGIVEALGIVSSHVDIYHLQILTALHNLYGSVLHPSVTILLRGDANSKLLDIIFKTAKQNPANKPSKDDFGVDEISDNPTDSQSYADILPTSDKTSTFLNEHGLSWLLKKKILATKVLASFWFISNTPWTASDRGKSVEFLQYIQELALNPNVHVNLHQIIHTLNYVSSSADLNDLQMPFTMEILKLLTQKKTKDSKVVVYILDTVKKVLPHLQKAANIDHRSIALTILIGFTKLINKDSFGPEVRIALIKCLGRGIEVDADQTWLLWSSQNDETCKSVTIDIVNYLQGRFHEVRLVAAQYIKPLFCIIAPHWDRKRTKSWHNNVFSTLCLATIHSFNNISSKFSAEVKEDEISNLTTTALQSYGIVILSNPYWRKKATFSIFQQSKERNLNLNLVKSMFEMITNELGASSVKNYLTVNLRILISMWLHQEYKLEDFPWALLECTSEVDFLQTYTGVIVPILIQKKNDDILSSMCVKLQQPVTQVLEDCFPEIFSLAVPFIDRNSELKYFEKDIEHSKELMAKLNEKLGEKRTYELLLEHLDKVIIQLFSYIHEPSQWYEMFGHDVDISFPQPNKPVLELAHIEHTLKYIQHLFANSNKPLLIHLIHSSLSHIQVILQEMASTIHEAPTQEDRITSFLQYSAFINILTDFLENNQLSQVTMFVIRDIVYTLVNLLKSPKSTHTALIVAVCVTLQKISSKCIEYCLPQFEQFLPIVINTLVSINKKSDNKEVINKTIMVMEQIIIKNRDKLKKCIENLDPFPCDSKFGTLQTIYEEIKYGMQEYTLQDEIENFLQASGQGTRSEGLIHLRSQLSCRKEELKKMYEDLNNVRGFSEDCAKSNLHQLICTLVKLTSHPEVSIEAAKCLGELGPSDLKSLVLQPETTFNVNTPQLALCQRKLELLIDYLVDINHDVAKCASAALYSLLQIEVGLQALKTINNKEFIEPFKSKPKNKSALTVHSKIIEEKLNDDEVWCPSLPTRYTKWIVNLVCTMLETISFTPKYIEQLKAVCNAKEEFAAELLPRLVYVILYSESDTSIELVSDKLNLFFSKHFEGYEYNKNISSLDSNSSRYKRNLIHLDKKSVQCMLNVVQFVRTQEHGMQHKVGTKSLLDLNYLHVAKAAQFCSAYFSSLFYVELWGMERKFSRNPYSTFLTIDEMCDDSENGKALHAILLHAYKNIGDPDAVNGCGMSRLLDPQSRIWYYEHDNNWNKVSLLQDIGTTAHSPNLGLAISLHHSGFHHLLKAYVGAEPSEEMKALQYECCWRLGQWDMPTATEMGRGGHNNLLSYDAHHYSSLKSLHNLDLSSFEQEIQNARLSVLKSLSHISLESSKNVYSDLCKLQALQELEDFSTVLTSENINEMLNKWKLQDKISCSQFEYREPILSQRICLLGISSSVRNEVLNKDPLAESLLTLAEAARKDRWFHVSERALRKLTDFGENLGVLMELSRKVEEAQNLWAQGSCDLGRHLLLSVLLTLSKVNDRDLKELRAKTLRLYGTWLVETRSENAHTIINKYFLEAVNILNGMRQSQQELVNALRSVARFADIEFQRVDKYMKSPMFESKRQCMQKSEEDAKTLKQGQSQSKDIVRAINVNVKQSKLDRSEISNITQERSEYLHQALTYYLKSLHASGNSNEEDESSSVFRIVSLWLDNRVQLHEDEGNSDLETCLGQTLPSYKFLPVVPQLVPHISNGTHSFDKTLVKLMERLTEDHPHHVLPTLFALSLLHEDAPFLEKASRAKPPQPEARVVAAQSMIARLRQRAKLSKTIAQMESAARALIQLAYDKHPQGKETAVALNSNHPITKITNYDQMQLSTLDLPICIDGNYNNIIGIHSYEKKYYMVGGINAPKKIICTGTDGIKRIQLLKGQDDLHQDAVMQQVFTIMNSLLHRNKQTRDRKLLIRTYKVVPLSQRSGVIEWCDNTEPIGGYLLKAHPLYRPTDKIPMVCKSNMGKYQQHSNEKRLEVYLDICKNIKPVFHNFFTENFPQPGVWFERRLAYIKSVATTSMIGYVLGLGDRHVQNILVDKSTAEVIHIDFGIAFEQGLVLNVPETVPFRLTRDIEDGMGVSGVEGVFRRCCEETMTVMRESQETLLTILQVLLYDPLYMWTISPERNQNDRRGIKGARDATASEKEVNKTAERALLRLQHKLMGTEEGTPTSVAGQVNRLIQQARDPENLSRLFHGWQPYL